MITQAVLLETTRLIQSTGYFKDVRLKVSFGAGTARTSVSRVFGNRKDRRGKQRSIHVTVPPHWIRTVYDQGLAIISNSFILRAMHRVPPGGCEWAYKFIHVALNHWNVQEVEQCCVKFAGSVYWHATCEEAFEFAKSQIEARLLPNSMQLRGTEIDALWIDEVVHP